MIPINYKEIKFSGIYICAKGYTEEEYFNSNGDKVDTEYTGVREITGQNCYIATDSNNRYSIVDKDGKELVNDDYIYIDHAFDKYFIAYKKSHGHGVIDKNGNVKIEFEHNVLSRIGDKQMLKGVDMGKASEVITIFSKDMKELVKLSGRKNYCL